MQDRTEGEIVIPLVENVFRPIECRQHRNLLGGTHLRKRLVALAFYKPKGNNHEQDVVVLRLSLDLEYLYILILQAVPSGLERGKLSREVLLILVEISRKHFALAVYDRRRPRRGIHDKQEYQRELYPLTLSCVPLLTPNPVDMQGR